MSRPSNANLPDNVPFEFIGRIKEYVTQNKDTKKSFLTCRFEPRNRREAMHFIKFFGGTSFSGVVNHDVKMTEEAKQRAGVIDAHCDQFPQGSTVRAFVRAKWQENRDRWRFDVYYFEEASEEDKTEWWEEVPGAAQGDLAF